MTTATNWDTTYLGPTKSDHGPALPIPELRRIVAADCPRWTAAGIHDRCGVHFPGLATVF